MTGSVVQLYSASFHTILSSHLKLTGDLQLVLTTNTAVFGPAAMGLCWLLNIQNKKKNFIDPSINYSVYSAVLRYSVCWGRSVFSFLFSLLALPTNYGKQVYFSRFWSRFLKAPSRLVLENSIFGM